MVMKYVNTVTPNTVTQRFVNYIEHVQSASSVNQTIDGTGLDVPITLNYGSGGGTPTDPVQVLPNGDIVFNQAGSYTIIIDAHVGRDTNSGTVKLFAAMHKNGTAYQDSTKFILLPDANLIVLQTIVWNVTVEAGDTFHLDMIRDSDGNTSGNAGVITDSPTNSIFPDARSISISVGQYQYDFVG